MGAGERMSPTEYEHWKVKLRVVGATNEQIETFAASVAERVAKHPCDLSSEFFEMAHNSLCQDGVMPTTANEAVKRDLINEVLRGMVDSRYVEKFKALCN